MARKALRARGTRLGVGLVGTGFMGRAHANAWRQAPCFFDLSPRPVLQAVAGTKSAPVRAFAERWEVARMLDAGGKSYREIAAEAQASPTTVVRVARFLKEMPHQGYRLVLDRLKV